jgi:hypothetical protein
MESRDSAPDLPCYCINLDKRPERWQQTLAAFQGTGIQPVRFSAIEEKPGWIGCGKSHTAIIRAAKEKKLPWVLVIEDDCVPTAGFGERWPQIREDLWATREQWDIFYGGVTTVHPPVHMITTSIGTVDQARSTHFYVINEGAYDKALTWGPDKTPIDYYWANTPIRQAFVQPFLAIQRPSESDIEEKNVDYLAWFKKAETNLTKFRYADRHRLSTFVGGVVIGAGVLWWYWRRRAGRQA